MSAGSLNIAIEQGATWQRTLTITDDGVALNLTGYTARMEVRANVGNTGAPLIDLPGAAGTLTLSGVTGIITIVLPAATTKALVAPNMTPGFQPYGVWSLELTDGSGVVTRLLEGAVTLSPEITR